MRVLLVDDHAPLRSAVRRVLRQVPDTEVIEADGYESGLRAASEDCDLMFVDIRLGERPDDRGGLRLLETLRKQGREVPAIVLTGSVAADDIRAAFRLGARDYLLKDEIAEQLLVPLVTSFREPTSATINEHTLPPPDTRTLLQRSIVGSSALMADVRRRIGRVANSAVPVLVLGDTGTGKEMVARAIHDLGDRRSEPFVAVNCAAIPASLLESMLFGHERGAFTGAERRTPGRFAAARSGTILLDEIGEMPLELQAKFLRVLEDGRYLPVGAEQEVELRARVLASTNVDLSARVAEGRFRHDLFFRLDVVTIRLPTLAQRAEDIEELVVALSDTLPRRLRFSKPALEWLQRRAWPGNVRELRNALRRLTVMTESEIVDVATLVELVPPTIHGDLESPLKRLIGAVLDMPDDGRSRQRRLDRLLIEAALARCGGNKSAAARLLGIPRKVFARRLESLTAPAGAGADDDSDYEEDERQP